MGQVSININGRDYNIACADGEEEHVSKLAGQVAVRVEQLAGTVGQLGEARMLLMACLVFADELSEIADQGQNAADGATGEQLDAISERIERIAASLKNA